MTRHLTLIPGQLEIDPGARLGSNEATSPEQENKSAAEQGLGVAALNNIIHVDFGPSSGTDPGGSDPHGETGYMSEERKAEAAKRRAELWDNLIVADIAFQEASLKTQKTYPDREVKGWQTFFNAGMEEIYGTITKDIITGSTLPIENSSRVLHIDNSNDRASVRPRHKILAYKGLGFIQNAMLLYTGRVDVDTRESSIDLLKVTHNVESEDFPAVSGAYHNLIMQIKAILEDLDPTKQTSALDQIQAIREEIKKELGYKKGLTNAVFKRALREPSAPKQKTTDTKTDPTPAA